MSEGTSKSNLQIGHYLIAALPLLAGWICWVMVKGWVLMREAFRESYEIGRRL